MLAASAVQCKCNAMQCNQSINQSMQSNHMEGRKDGWMNRLAQALIKQAKQSKASKQPRRITEYELYVVE